MLRVYTRCGWFGLVIFAFFLGGVPTARAAFHFMQIEQIIGGVNGDTTAQAIQLRMAAGNQHFVAGSRVSAVNSAGGSQLVLQNMTSDLPGPSATGRRILLATPNFANYTNVPLAADFIMTPIPVSYLAAGQVRFTNNNGGIIYWSISWGGSSFTGSTTGDFTNDADGNFGPPVNIALPSTSLQALLFDGLATDKSTTNLADYILTPGAATFTNYAGTSFTLVAPEPSTGDFDNDGDVDGRDFLKWQRGESPDPLSEEDLEIWQEQYGTSGLGAGVTAISEPGALAGLVLFGIGAILRRRRAA
jgi:hypothetical protein